MHGLPYYTNLTGHEDLFTIFFKAILIQDTYPLTQGTGNWLSFLACVLSPSTGIIFLCAIDIVLRPASLTFP